MFQLRLFALALCCLCLVALPWRTGRAHAAPGVGTYTLSLPLVMQLPSVPYPHGFKGLIDTTIDGDTDIVVIGDDGIVETILSTDTLNNGDASWSPDGAYVLYHEYSTVTDTQPLTDRLIIQRTDGSDRRPLQNFVGLETQAWSPDGAWLLVLSNLGAGNIPYSLHLSDGTATQPFTPIFENDRAARFGWSPDGTAFFYTRDIYVNGAYDTRLYVYTPATAQTVTVATGLLLQQAEMPVWSPDSQALAYNALASTEVHVFVVGRDGTGKTEVTPDGVSDGVIGWTDADHLLLSTRLTSGGRQLLLATTDGTERTPFSDPALPIVNARVLDSGKVLYQTGGGVTRLYLQATNATAPILLLQAPGSQTLIDFDAVTVVDARGFVVIPTRTPTFRPPPNDYEYGVYRADFTATAATTWLVTTGLVNATLLPDTDYLIGYSSAPYGRPLLYHFPTGRHRQVSFALNGGYFRFYEWRPVPSEQTTP